MLPLIRFQTGRKTPTQSSGQQRGCASKWKSGSISNRNHGCEASTRGEESEGLYTRAPPQRVGRVFALLTKTYHGSRITDNWLPPHKMAFRGRCDAPVVRPTPKVQPSSSGFRSIPFRCVVAAGDAPCPKSAHEHASVWKAGGLGTFARRHLHVSQNFARGALPAAAGDDRCRLPASSGDFGTSSAGRGESRLDRGAGLLARAAFTDRRGRAIGAGSGRRGGHRRIGRHQDVPKGEGRHRRAVAPVSARSHDERLSTSSIARLGAKCGIVDHRRRLRQ